MARYKNPDNDPRGPWLLSDLAARNYYAAGRYPIKTPTGRIIDGPPAGSYWRVSKDKFAELEKDGRIWWGKKGNNRPGIKRFLSEVQSGVVPQTLWLWKDVGSTRHAKQELSQLLAAGASQDLFVTPKPRQLLERILQIGTNPGDIILDSFAGSGTTGHAALSLNSQTQDIEYRRRFVLIEMDSDIATSLTAERLARATKGYVNTKGEHVNGLGGGFRFVTLGAPLFDETGNILSEVCFADLAAHVFFVETGVPLPKRTNGRTPLLGVHNGVAIYLLFNGILGDKTPQGGNVLTRSVLEHLPPHDGPKVVFGTGCRIGPERLRRERVIFRQIPYQVRVE